MKKNIAILLLFCTLSLIFLNADTTTKQCINYECRAVKIPLYLKALDFFNRHFHYAQLAAGIAAGERDKEKRAIKILEWTYRNIQKNPLELPVIDDHAWHIIVRGYAIEDQFQDVFTTLCNYAHIEAFFTTIHSEDAPRRRSLSFVKLKIGWSVFDASRGVYFINRQGRIASIEDISSGKWQAFSISGEAPTDYTEFLRNIESVKFENWQLSRSAIQSPLKRLIFWSRMRKSPTFNKK